MLGAIVLAEQPLTVTQIARRMGLTRQSVHPSVSRLVADGMVKLVANVDHRRSRLVQLTDVGRATYAAIDRKQATWVNDLSAGITRAELETTARVLSELCERLETAPPSDRRRP